MISEAEFLAQVLKFAKLHDSGKCKRGHEVNEENTYFYATGPRKGRVAICRMCKRERRREANQRKCVSSPSNCLG